MSNLDRLRQYIGKASFSSEVDRLAAIACITEEERMVTALIEGVEDAAVEWAAYVEVDAAPITLPKRMAEAISKATRNTH